VHFPDCKKTFNLFIFLELASLSSYALVSFGCGAEELEASRKKAHEMETQLGEKQNVIQDLENQVNGMRSELNRLQAESEDKANRMQQAGERLQDLISELEKEAFEEVMA
jgi:chromosome segregation ATPase